MMHMQAAPGTSSRTGHALALSATVLGALWIAALAITAAAQRPDVSSWPLALALLAAAALTWLGLATRTIRPRPYVALLGIIGLAQLANSSAAGTAWSITSTVTLAALSAGLLLRPATAARRAIGILTITAAAVLTVVLGIAWFAQGGQTPPVNASRAYCWASFGNRLASKKAQNQATKNITSEAMNMIMP